MKRSYKLTNKYPTKFTVDDWVPRWTWVIQWKKVLPENSIFCSECNSQKWIGECALCLKYWGQKGCQEVFGKDICTNLPWHWKLLEMAAIFLRKNRSIKMQDAQVLFRVVTWNQFGEFFYWMWTSDGDFGKLQLMTKRSQVRFQQLPIFFSKNFYIATLS